MDLQALADFNLVASHGGFGAASRASGRSKATLSRRVRELEDSLGVRLLERGSKALRLTDEGEALHAGTEGPLQEIVEVGNDARASAKHPRGRLRVSAPLLFSHIALGRLSAAFLAAYPDVRLEVTVEDRIVEVVGEGYDAVIRINPRADTALVGRLFLRDRMMVVATVAAPSMPGDAPVVEVPAVVMTNAPDRSIWHFSTGARECAVAPRPVLRLPSLLMIRDAVLRGAGAAVLPASIVQTHLADGSLIAWGPTADRAVEIWVLHTARRLVSPKVRAFVDFLCDAFPDASLSEG